ncbi:MAG: type VI secretion system tube protein Hcp [Thermoanaerobaculia bacterium]|nr:type VI secretion system tube protein Hcp [Thermoanaerobaculia bacterium]
MKRTSRILVMALGLVLATNAPAAYEGYLKIDGIPGESTDAAHHGFIDVHSFHWGVAPPAPPAAPAPAGVARGGPARFSFSKRVDKSSPLLKQAAASGKQIPSAVIEVLKAGPGPRAYLSYELKNVMVSSYSMSGQGAGDPIPTEQVTLNFSSIELKYVEQKKPGAAPNRISGAANPAPGGQTTTTSRPVGK